MKHRRRKRSTCAGTFHQHCFRFLDSMTNTVSMTNNTRSASPTRIATNESSSIAPLDPHTTSLSRSRVKRVTIELGDLTQHNLKQLKVLNRDVFPVAYNEKFYKDLLGAGELCKLGRHARTRGESIALNEPEERSHVDQSASDSQPLLMSRD